MNIKELVIGGVAGAALALVATQLLGGAQATPPAAAASVAAAPADTVAPPSPVPEAGTAASAHPVGASAVATAKVAAAALACPPAVAALDAKKAASAAAPAAASHADVPAVSLSAEHAKLLLARDHEPPPTLPELHARFAGEPLDLPWSQPLEAQLRQALQDAGVQKGFEVLAVECRRTLCELRLFGSGPDAGRRWDAVMAQLMQQPWWGQNIGGTTMSTMAFNDRTVIAGVLQRAKH